LNGLLPENPGLPISEAASIPSDNRTIPTNWITSPSDVRIPRDTSRSLNLNPTAERTTVIIRIVPEYSVRLSRYKGDVAPDLVEDISIYVPNVLRVLPTGINGLAAFIRIKLK
jgi:hypothetical protein